MRILLVPGFWLTASSWDPVLPALRADGLDPIPLTPEGLAPDHPDPASVTLRDQIDAVVALVDGAGEPVVLVGHSGGAAVIHAVADARPDSVARAVYVDSLPLRDGGVINDELPAVDGLIPLPDWSAFDDFDLVDLTEDLRDHLARIAVPEPEHVARDRQHLHDPRRYEVPVTVICCAFPCADLQAMIATPDHPWHAYVSEVGAIHDVTWIDLPTGHWPQLTKPAELADALVEAIRPTR